MSDYIKRDDAIEVLSHPVTMSMCLTKEEVFAKREQRDIDIAPIRDIPAADVVERKVGRWKPFDLTYGRSFYSCTACGAVAYVLFTEGGVPIFRYCPNCGAKMEDET